MQSAFSPQRLSVAAALISLLLLPPAVRPGNGESVQPAPPPDHAALLARIEELNGKVDELSRLVKVLISRADPEKKPADPEEKAPASPRSAIAEAEESDKGTDSDSRALGKLRMSGDFRLRLDGIFRPSHNPVSSDQLPLEHVQHVTGSYRFRLNVDTDVHRMVSFHGQLTTGAANNPLTLDQEFSGITVRHPFQVHEAWVNFHPADWAVFYGGRVQNVFADFNPLFLLDEDVRFNGFNQRFTKDFSKRQSLRRIELRSGQYIFTNPRVAIVTEKNLGPSGARIGSTGRSSQLFQQGFIIEYGRSPKPSHTFGADIQLYRNPNQIQFASTPAGVPILIQNGLGFALSGPPPGIGNATTTPGGAIYTARRYQVARLFYRFEYDRLKSRGRDYPIVINLQASRNVGTGAQQRDGMVASFRIGAVSNPWDHMFQYLFAIKGANSMISQLTDSNLGTFTGVNIRSHHFRFDVGLSKRIQLQTLFFFQDQLSNSGQYPSFFVPVNAYAPRLFRFQEQILFIF